MPLIGAYSGIEATALTTAVGIAGAGLGLWLTGLRKRARVVVPFSAGVLLGVAVFGLLPELAKDAGWGVTLALFATGYAALLLVNRFAYPVCPTCAHDHDHDACSTKLHGFAGPLIAAAAVHSFLDGWIVATVHNGLRADVQVAIPLAVALHKAPEGMALGGILRASLKSRTQAAMWAIIAEGATIVGGALGVLAGPALGSQWTTFPLGLAAGWLTYLGFHAVHEEWHRKGAKAAAIAGVAGAALVLGGLV